MIGICKLCLQSRLLQRSHLLPAAVYKRLYSQKAANPNPLLISSAAIVQTSRQTQTWLLCTDCEDVLNRRGERWLLPLIANADKTFLLYDRLSKIQPDVVLPKFTAYAAVKSSEINVNALTHFALGIFWKASVHSWRSQNPETQINLGPYQESLRNYVLHSSSDNFPKNISLMVVLLPPSNVPLLANIPVGGPRGEGYRNYKFYIPGIQFVLCVGKTVDLDICFYNNPLHPIYVQDIRKEIEKDPIMLMNKLRSRNQTGNLQR